MKFIILLFFYTQKMTFLNHNMNSQVVVTRNIIQHEFAINIFFKKFVFFFYFVVFWDFFLLLLAGLGMI